MPIHVIQCRACHEQSEVLSLGREPMECPNCKTRDVDKIPAIFGYRWNCDNSGGTSPRRIAETKEEDRKAGKRERVTGMLDRQARRIDGENI